MIKIIPIGDGNGNTVEVDFFVDENNILQPLGVLVTGDSRDTLLPSTKDNSEEIPGVDGEIDFGTNFGKRVLELDVASLPSEYFTKKELRFMYAKHLDPTKGYKSLVFADDIEKMYYVKYSGQIPITNYANWFRFTIPFKVSNEFIVGTFEKTLVGGGILTNDGMSETGVIIEIDSVFNPSITIDGETLAYTGPVPVGQILVIDTNKQTAKLVPSNANVVGNYNGAFPKLQPGNTSVNAGSIAQNVTIRWRDKWK